MKKTISKISKKRSFLSQYWGSYAWIWGILLCSICAPLFLIYLGKFILWACPPLYTMVSVDMAEGAFYRIFISGLIGLYGLCAITIVMSLFIGVSELICYIKQARTCLHAATMPLTENELKVEGIKTAQGYIDAIYPYLTYKSGKTHECIKLPVETEKVVFRNLFSVYWPSIHNVRYLNYKIIPLEYLKFIYLSKLDTNTLGEYYFEYAKIEEALKQRNKATIYMHYYFSESVSKYRLVAITIDEQMQPASIMREYDIEDDVVAAFEQIKVENEFQSEISDK